MVNALSVGRCCCCDHCAIARRRRFDDPHEQTVYAGAWTVDARGNLQTSAAGLIGPPEVAPNPPYRFAAEIDARSWGQTVELWGGVDGAERVVLRFTLAAAADPDGCGLAELLELTADGELRTIAADVLIGDARPTFDVVVDGDTAAGDPVDVAVDPLAQPLAVGAPVYFPGDGGDREPLTATVAEAADAGDVLLRLSGVSRDLVDDEVGTVERWHALELRLCERDPQAREFDAIGVVHTLGGWGESFGQTATLDGRIDPALDIGRQVALGPTAGGVFRTRRWAFVEYDYSLDERFEPCPRGCGWVDQFSTDAVSEKYAIRAGAWETSGGSLRATSWPAALSRPFVNLGRRNTVEASVATTAAGDGDAALVYWNLADLAGDVFVAARVTFGPGGGVALLHDGAVVASAAAAVPLDEPVAVRVGRLVKPGAGDAGIYVAEIEPIGGPATRVSAEFGGPGTVHHWPNLPGLGVAAEPAGDLAFDLWRHCGLGECGSCGDVLPCLITAGESTACGTPHDWTLGPSAHGGNVPGAAAPGDRFMLTAGELYAPDGVCFAARLEGGAGDAIVVLFTFEDANNWSGLRFAIGALCTRVERVTMAAGVLTVDYDAGFYTEISAAAPFDVLVCLPAEGAASAVFDGGQIPVAGAPLADVRLGLLATAVAVRPGVRSASVSHHAGDVLACGCACYACQVSGTTDGAAPACEIYGGSGTFKRVHPAQSGRLAGRLTGFTVGLGQTKSAVVTIGNESFGLTKTRTPANTLSVAWTVNGNGPFASPYDRDEYAFAFCYAAEETSPGSGRPRVSYLRILNPPNGAEETFDGVSLGGGDTISHAGDGALVIDEWTHDDASCGPPCFGCLGRGESDVDPPASTRIWPPCPTLPAYRFTVAGLLGPACAAYNAAFVFAFSHATGGACWFFSAPLEGPRSRPAQLIVSNGFQIAIPLFGGLAARLDFVLAADDAAFVDWYTSGACLGGAWALSIPGTYSENWPQTCLPSPDLTGILEPA